MTLAARCGLSCRHSRIGSRANIPPGADGRWPWDPAASPLHHIGSARLKSDTSEGVAGSPGKPASGARPLPMTASTAAPPVIQSIDKRVEMVPRGGPPHSNEINSLVFGGTKRLPVASLCFSGRVSHQFHTQKRRRPARGRHQGNVSCGNNTPHVYYVSPWCATLDSRPWPGPRAWSVLMTAARPLYSATAGRGQSRSVVLKGGTWPPVGCSPIASSTRL